uniref:Uncharacterized protein n=1 Tax=viral metagenome TaxID=1070528 RepID=A0A6C0CKV2_9ZZZZ
MSAWIELVKEKYALGKKTDKEYTLKKAILAAKKDYKKPATMTVRKKTQKRKKTKGKKRKAKGKTAKRRKSKK